MKLNGFKKVKDSQTPFSERDLNSKHPPPPDLVREVCQSQNGLISHKLSSGKCYCPHLEKVYHDIYRRTQAGPLSNRFGNHPPSFISSPPSPRLTANDSYSFDPKDWKFKEVKNFVKTAFFGSPSPIHTLRASTMLFLKPDRMRFLCRTERR